MSKFIFWVGCGFTILILVSCGGGEEKEGNDASRTLSMPAHTTAEYFGSKNDAALDDGLLNWFPDVLNVAMHLPRELVHIGIPVANVNEKVEEIETGPDGGEVHITGVRSADGDDWFLFEFDNFANGHVVFNGSILQETTGFGSWQYPDALYSFNDFTVMVGSDAVTLQGMLEFVGSDDDERLTANMIIIDEADNTSIYLDEWQTRVTYGSQNEFDYSGRIYHEDFGGVEVRTYESLVYTMDIPNPASGVMKLQTPSGDDFDAMLEMLNPYFASLEWNDDERGPVQRRIDYDADRLPAFLLSLPRPLADAGPIPTDHVALGEEFVIDARFSVSYSERPLTYEWQLLSAPHGSTTQLSESNGAVTSLVPDMSGRYLVKLTASDGLTSSRDLFAFTADEYVSGDGPVAASGVQVVHAPEVENEVFYDVRTMVNQDQYPVSFANSGAGIDFSPERDFFPDQVAIDGFGTIDLNGYRGATILAAGGQTSEAISRVGKYRLSQQIQMHYGDSVPDRAVRQMHVKDLDGDGLDDLVTLPRASIWNDYTTGIYIYPAVAPFRFAASYVIETGEASGYAFGDVTGDGAEELVVVEDCAVVFFKNDGNGNFTQLASVARTRCDSHVTDQPPFIADLDADGQATVLLLDDANELRLIELDIIGTVTRNETLAFNYNVPTSDSFPGTTEAIPRQVKAVDMDLDGKLDLVFSHSVSTTAGGGGLSIFLQEGDDSTYTQGETGDFHSNLGATLTMGDFDGDGNMDLAGGYGRRIQVWLARSGGPVMSAEIVDDWDNEDTAEFEGPFLVAGNLDDDPQDEIFAPTKSFGSVDSLIVDFDTNGEVAQLSFPMTPAFLPFQTGIGGGLYQLHESGWSGLVYDVDGDGYNDLLLPDLDGINLFLQMD